jgi:hypothetical protein
MGSGDAWQRDGSALLRELAALEERMRRDYAASLTMVAELAARDVAAEVGYPDLGLLLRDVLRISQRDARRRMSHAIAVTDVPVISGGTLPPALPIAAAALAEGVLGGDHLDVIGDALRELPTHVPDTDRSFAERTLVDAARELDAGRLGRVGRRVRAWLDENGRQPTESEPVETGNLLHLSMKPNGRTTFRGELDPEHSTLLTTLLSPLAHPLPRTEADGGQCADRRGVAGRNGDALAEILRLVADSGSLPTEGGERPHLLVTVSLETLRADVGTATLDGGGRRGDAVPSEVLDAGSARRLACDARVVPAVLGTRSEPLDIGRAAYVVSTAIRRALVLRDGGCAFPGCDRNQRWCHAHHVRHWIDGGHTGIDNLVLLCGRHHRMVHHSDWDCAIIDGRPEFLPPEFVDPLRRPRRAIPPQLLTTRGQRRAVE